MISDFRDIKSVWMSNEGYYSVGEDLKTTDGSLNVIGIQCSEEGVHIVVRRDKDGWHGVYATVQKAHIVGLLYEIPKIEEVTDASS